MTEPLKLHDRQLDLIDVIGRHKYILAYGSSRGGKTFAFFYAMVIRALMYPCSNHAVIRQTGASIKTTVWDTASQVLSAIAPGYRDEVQTNQTDRCITLHNGSTIWFLGAQNEEAVSKIMGAEFATILLNEVVDISFDTYGDILSRLNASNVDANGTRISLKLFADCNPKTFDHWVYQQWLLNVIPGSNTPLFDAHEFASIAFDRHSNPEVADGYYDAYRNQSAAKQARFMNGVWRASSEDTLFSRDDLDNNRDALPAQFDITIVAVDPAVTNTPESDESGIIVAGPTDTDTDAGHYYPIEDLSGRYHSHEWAMIAIKAYWRHGAAAIVVETNQGGSVWEETIHAIDPRVNVVTVRAGAGQGKNARAQPIAMLMKAGRIHHPFNDNFKALERQILAMTGDYDRKRGKSPDRLDAYVYAIGELLTGDGPIRPLVVSKIANYFAS